MFQMDDQLSKEQLTPKSPSNHGGLKEQKLDPLYRVWSKNGVYPKYEAYQQG